MRVVRGYKYDNLVCVDGAAFPVSQLRDAAFSELSAAGSTNLAYDAPPFFQSGSPYGDAIVALAERNGISPLAAPDDMDVSFVLHDGIEPAMASRKWCEVFGVDPKLHWHKRMIQKEQD